MPGCAVPAMVGDASRADSRPLCRHGAGGGAQPSQKHRKSTANVSHLHGGIQPACPAGHGPRPCRVSAPTRGPASASTGPAAQCASGCGMVSPTVAARATLPSGLSCKCGCGAGAGPSPNGVLTRRCATETRRPIVRMVISGARPLRGHFAALPSCCTAMVLDCYTSA